MKKVTIFENYLNKNIFLNYVYLHIILIFKIDIFVKFIIIIFII